MASDTSPPKDTGNAQGPEAAVSPEHPSLSIVTQYIKDLSFENPRAPLSIVEGDSEPHGEISIQVKTRVLGGDNYEVVLEFGVEAKHEDEIAFLVELAYGGVFSVRGLEGELVDRATMVDCPRMLFPFARRIIADAVRDGGFSPLLLAPVDFLKLYQQRTAPAPENTNA